MKHYTKKKSKSSRRLSLLIALTLTLALLLAVCVILDRNTSVTPLPSTSENNPVSSDTQPTPTEADSLQTEAVVESPTPSESAGKIGFPIQLDNGIIITDMGKYAGLFVEDGSDEPVSGILMIRIANQSGKDLHLATITLTVNGQQALFQITTLPSGEEAVLLEQNRMPYTDTLPTDVSAENVVFSDSFSMYEDQVKITTHNGVINVENISGENIEKDIFVYYKNYAGGIYHGGITYRLRISGGLKAGEVRQLMASRFYESSSRIMMVTIGG